ncbi:MAG TPA: hypothetical protein VLK30_14045 [Candidatus Limnocylindrales bacterium]|nr:hypothetical protein [Candidatus Limnocylindrales bacterium]
MTGDLSWIGVWLLVLGVVAILVEGAIATLWTVRLSRRAAALNVQLAALQAELRSDVERLRAALAETQALWQPYRGLLRLLRHPLTIALMQSYARRRARAR